MMLLHGEEHLENYKPIPPNTKIVVTEKILDIQDKGSGAALVMETILTNEATKE